MLAGNERFEVTEGEVSFDGMNLLDMSVEDRARAGLFLGFQYPVEIPGVSMANFLKYAVNEKRKYLSLIHILTTMHNTMLFFTEKGRCYWLKVYAIPEGARASKGRAIQNVIQIEPDDKVRAYINVRRLDDKESVSYTHLMRVGRRVRRDGLRFLHGGGL